MSNLASWLAFFGGGGTVTGLVATARYLSDERVRRRAEKKAAAQAPLEAKSYELRIAERAGRVAQQSDEIQQHTIDTLRRDYADLEKRFEKHRTDAEAQRETDMREADRLRENDRILLASARDEIRRLTEKVQDQDATIAQLRFELQQARA